MKAFNANSSQKTTLDRTEVLDLEGLRSKVLERSEELKRYRKQLNLLNAG